MEKFDYIAELTHSTIESLKQPLEHANAGKLGVLTVSIIQQESNKWNYSDKVNNAIVLDLETFVPNTK